LVGPNPKGYHPLNSKSPERAERRSGWRRQQLVHRHRKNGDKMSKVILLSHFVKNINHFLKNDMQDNLLGRCPKFRQISQTPSSSVVWRCSPQLFNRVIHRFRGYPESMCHLNLLTKR
jgi:hypothetical protein